MKKGRIILTAVAFLFAIVSAFASLKTTTTFLGFWDDTNNALDVSCTAGVLVESNACDGNGNQCHVRISVGGDATTVLAFTVDDATGLTCSSPAKLR